jgi:hypothetical protein
VLCPKRIILVEVVALLLIPLTLWLCRSYRSTAEIRMLFWHPKGTPNIPQDLISESGTRKVLRSHTVRERVNRRLDWELTEKEYSQSLDLVSNRHHWNPKSGVYLQIVAVSDTPERSKLLCQIAAEEFCGRCTELSLEYDQLYWEVEMAKVHGPLAQWRYQNQAQDPSQLEAQAKKVRQRLQIAIAATQMRISRMKRNSGSGSANLSEKTVKLVENLKELESALDELWLRGVSNESAKDLKSQYRERQKELRASFQADQAAALDAIQSKLEKLQSKESRLSAEAVARAADELGELQEAVAALRRAKDMALGEISMYCMIFRPAQTGRLAAAKWTKLSPALLAWLVLLFSCLAHRRAYLRYQAENGKAENS